MDELKNLIHEYYNIRKRTDALEGAFWESLDDSIDAECNDYYHSAEEPLAEKIADAISSRSSGAINHDQAYLLILRTNSESELINTLKL